MNNSTNRTTPERSPRGATRWSILPLIAGALAIAACDIDFDLDSGPTVERTFDLASFDSIDIGAPFEVTIRQGEIQSVVIEIGERRLDDVRVDVVGGELSIDLDDGFFGGGDLIASITTTDLERLSISTAADVVLIGVEVDELDVRVSGASQLQASGTIEQLDLELSGASNAMFDGTTIGDVTIDMSGASSGAFPHSTGEIRGTMSGASSLDVDESTVTRIDTSGASSIDRD